MRQNETPANIPLEGTQLIGNDKVFALEVMAQLSSNVKVLAGAKFY
jgi:hypothetical protein